MHDGYIFTLGIAGAAGGPTADCLDAMLAALPPVKRAAYLGDVLMSEGLPSLSDPLILPILGDVADAEVLLIVTPFIAGRLPPRIAAVTRTMPPADRRRFAALITLGEGDATSLRAWLAATNAELCAELALSADGATAQTAATDASGNSPADRLAACARAAYAAARALHPSALQ